MRQVRLRGVTQEKHEPYPLNEFPPSLIQDIAKRIVHLKAVGLADISGDAFSRIFADSIKGKNHIQPLGVADVSWNGCCWSLKTVKNTNPFSVSLVRLISGRNSPVYSAGINDPFHDVQATGTSVLDIYNQRIEQAKLKHDDIRLLVLIRNMSRLEFTLFERTIAPVAVNNYKWQINKNDNLVGFDRDRHAYTWQPHGSQFTIHEPVPPGATQFRIAHPIPKLEMNDVLKMAGFVPDWVEIINKSP